jgi:hypothetical protein
MSDLIGIAKTRRIASHLIRRHTTPARLTPR